MPQSDRNSQRENKPRGNEPSFNWRGVILIAVAFGFFALAMLFWRGNYPQLEDVPYNRFLELLENKQIVNDKNAPLTLFVEEGQPTQQLRGKYIKQGTGGAQNMELPFRTVVYLNFTSNLQDKLTAAGIQPSIRSESHPFGQALLSFGPVLFLLALLYFLFRQQIRMAGKGALNFGKSKARMLARDKNKITFKDVAGVEEAKDEVQELVEFLRDPKKFQKLGGRIPKGVLLVGPPGAANRPDVLDPALLRPGRFDRQITVNLPDVKGREEILRVHSKKVKLAEGVDLAVVARGTPGYSGAELANVINEAALLAARRGLKGITLAELEEARDKVRWGKERRSMALSEKEKTNTAYHEAGHALLLELF